MRQFVFATHAVTFHGEWVTPQNAEQQDYDSLFCLYCRLKIVVHIEPLTGTRAFVHLPGNIGNVSTLNSCRFSHSEQTLPAPALADSTYPRKLRPDTNTTIQNWHCCWCHISWNGKKICLQCEKSIYAISA